MLTALGGTCEDTCNAAQVVVLAPCAIAAALGVKVVWTATPLVIDMVADSFNLILTQLCALRPCLAMPK